MRGAVLGAAVILCAVMAFAASGSALAVFPGERGKIVFVSGKGAPANDDSGADVYILGAPGGNVTPLDTRAGQHRHPAWSPDLERVAYALWDTATNEKIWVQEIATGQTDRLGPHASNVRDDRPSWSPNGKRIAYESEVTDGSNQMDILVADISDEVTGAPIINLTDTPNRIEGRPVWSIDGETIYFSSRSTANADDDILFTPSNGQGGLDVVVNSAVAEYQPSVAPDGKRMCYTRGAFGSANADIYVKVIDETGPGYDLSDTDNGAFNCAWSPDSKFVAYVDGVFTNGALVYELADDTGAPQLMTTDTPNHFDGNPDWAPRRPAFCDGRPLTRSGTGGPDTINGTMQRDVIAAWGGNDVVRARGSNDLVCGGKGGDTIRGGVGNDKLRGEPGDDRLRGGKGKDTCIGGAGTDATSDCE